MSKQAQAETPERNRRIGRDFVMESALATCPHCGSMLFVENGKCSDCGKRATPPPAVMRALDQWPLKRLHARGVVTDIQFAAGWKYYQHWYAAGLSPLGAIDFGRVSGSAEPTAGMPASERQAHHRSMVRKAREAMRSLRGYVDIVVLEDGDPEEAGRRMRGWKNASQARAAGTEGLLHGLDFLADAYDLVARRG